MKPKLKSKFADMFVEIVDESAIYDAENYDGCKTINAIYRLHDKLIELNKRTEVELGILFEALCTCRPEGYCKTIDNKLFMLITNSQFLDVLHEIGVDVIDNNKIIKKH